MMVLPKRPIVFVDMRDEIEWQRENFGAAGLSELCCQPAPGCNVVWCNVRAPNDDTFRLPGIGPLEL